ncbi:DUF2336 domain-containing protein [Asticcacaulis sp. 201]|uniref:DUF2336 domain-containing protein n=1 Tax=Asticcacaulis sp. 201 TaxID=3028787 RepID=UPI002916D96A|nr:DUF2336 domain-containing protein [Asticcacaulis sp. 201]MDV6333030.1 DUF2336 domain-containing protein [Asticcacaulis sp. 201]
MPAPQLAPDLDVPVARPDSGRTTVKTRAPAVEVGDTDGRSGTPIHSDEDLIVRLCGMPVSLAAPLLQSALPTLTPQALLALVAATGEAHHRLIAARPGLDWRVIKALFRSHHDSVIAMMARNLRLDFDAEDEAAFARRAAASPDVRAAVLAHPGLKHAKASLRQDVTQTTGHGNLKLLALLRGGETAGFVREMSRRLKLEPAGLSQALSSPSPVPLALALCAAGLDRAVFLHVVSQWQNHHGGEPRLAEGQKPLILSVFSLAPEIARRKLAALINPAG